MTQKIDMNQKEVVAYKFDTELSKDDVKDVHNELRKAIGENKRVRFFADVSDLEDVTPGAIFEDLKLTPEYTTEIERFAIVGDDNWHEWLTKGADKVTKGEAKFFSTNELNQAKHWIQQ